MSSEPVTQTPVADTPAVEPLAAEPVAEPVAKTETDAPAAEAEPTTGEPTAVEADAATETVPVTEGVLGYKAPGLIKSLRFSKKYFWLGEEPLEESSISAYLRAEKSEAGHANAAFASQTGKGLLLFVKRVEDKASPAGILNLSDATAFTKEDTLDFSFKLGLHKYTFQAPTKAERDGWFLAIEKAAGEANTASEGVVGSEAYKSKLSKYSKPAGAAAVVATPAKSEDKVHDGATPAEATAVADTAAAPKTEKVEKSRSQSRKRQSIFGGFKNKLEDKKEAKAEEKEAKKEEETPVVATDDAAAEPVIAAEESAPIPATEETPALTTETTPTTTPLKSKRGSVFGTFFKPSAKKEEKKEEAKEDAAPIVPAKDTEPVAAEAPQLDPVDTAVPAETSAAAAEETTTEGVTSAAPGTTPKEKSGGFFGFLKQKEAQLEAKKEEKKEVKAEEKAEKEADKTEAPAATEEAVAPAVETAAAPTTPKDKRRSSFFGSLANKNKKSETTSDAEGTDGEKKNKLQGLFRKSSKATKPTTGPVTDSSAPPAISKDSEQAAETAPLAETSETAETAAPLTNGETETAVEAPAAESEALPTAPAVTASA